MSPYKLYDTHDLWLRWTTRYRCVRTRAGAIIRLETPFDAIGPPCPWR